MQRRVVITGLGCVSPLGCDAQSAWKHLVEGHSGVGPITLFDATSFPVRIAAEVSDWDVAQLGDSAEICRQHARQTQFAVGASLQAWSDAGLADRSHDPLQVGVYLGCGEIFPDFGQFSHVASGAFDGDHFDVDKFVRDSIAAPHGAGEAIYEPGAAVGLIAGTLDAQGPTANFTSACVSSSKAIGESLEVIRRGDADMMLAGGAHSMIHPFGVTGFHRLSTLSTRNDEPTKAERPFDRDRDGFVIGEGGAVLVLEELEHARRRGAQIYAEVTGYGATHDAFRITDPRPDGRAATVCIQQALAHASLNPEDIDYVNAHGSGTEINDKTETVALKQAFGDHAYHVPVSSTKSMTGHLTTACGAIEVFACAMAIHSGTIPPTINCDTPGEECDLDYVPNAARDIASSHILNNNLGFGGLNVALVVSRYTGGTRG